MAHLKGRRIIEFGCLVLNRFGDLRAAVAGIHAPQACGAIQNLSAIGSGVIHVLGGHQHARRLLELPVGRKRHPKGGEVIGGVNAVQHVSVSLLPPRASRGNGLIINTISAGKS
jgi:hypothetical protein